VREEKVGEPAASNVGHAPTYLLLRNWCCVLLGCRATKACATGAATADRSRAAGKENFMVVA